MHNAVPTRYRGRQRPSAFLLAILFVAAAATAFAQQPGSLDPTFGKGGKAIDARDGGSRAVAEEGVEGSCYVLVSNFSGGLPVSGGTFTLHVRDDEGCGWSLQSSEWITLSRDGGFGEATVECTVHANPGRPRRGVIYVFPLGPSPSFSSVSVYQAGGGVLDFDGDARADISVFRPSEGNWYLQRSRDGFAAVNWGLGTDKIVPADYDGDGKTDVAVYRPSEGKWYVLQSSNGTVFEANFGIAEDIPAPADFDGDGRADMTVYRPSTSTWWIWPTAWGGWRSAHFGTVGDIPVVGDYNGNGRADLAMFRPSTGTWFWSYELIEPSHNFIAIQFGLATDRPVVGDYDGDGKTDVAVYRASDGTWWIRNPTGNDTVVTWGIAEDKPVPADYDGDGRADVAVFRPSNGTWYIINSTAGFRGFQWGISTDVPSPGAFIP